jgi:dihydrodipicolinate reductase
MARSFGASNSVWSKLLLSGEQTLARLMKDFTQYKANNNEVHHTETRFPSGTAITLAKGLLIKRYL